jgi:cytochrome c
VDAWRYAAEKLMEKVRKGGAGVWGPVPMPPNPNVPDADLKALVNWVLSIK